MDWTEAVGLGLLQGLTEFLPVSSSGHLALLEYFLGLEQTPAFFDVLLHTGTLLAVLFYYRRSLWPIPFDGPARAGSHARMAGYLALATLPAVVLVVAVRPDESAAASWRSRVGMLRETGSSRPGMVLSFLSVTGAVVLAGARATGGSIDANSMRARHVLVIGMAQALSALCPGLSRSGMTISTGMLIGLRPEWAVHFSLLMSVPAIGGAVVWTGRNVDPDWLAGHLTVSVAAATVSALVGWFCISLLVGSVRRGRWWWFAVYVWLLAGTIACWLAGRSG